MFTIPENVTFTAIIYFTPNTNGKITSNPDCAVFPATPCCSCEKR